MHRGHHHHHDHDYSNGERLLTHGHNGPATDAAQWQTPHLHDHEDVRPGAPEPDFDLVEEAFTEAFPAASDPTSFLRLAGIPFIGRNADGRRLFLLRVDCNASTDVGSVTPLLGGGSVRYAPLPARMTSRRRKLGFVYSDGRETVSLTLGEARVLSDETLTDAADSTPKP